MNFKLFMENEQSFWQDIWKNRSDFSIWLIYADWLEEKGNDFFNLIRAVQNVTDENTLKAIIVNIWQKGINKLDQALKKKKLEILYNSYEDIPWVGFTYGKKKHFITIDLEGITWSRESGNGDDYFSQRKVSYKKLFNQFKDIWEPLAEIVMIGIVSLEGYLKISVPTLNRQDKIKIYETIVKINRLKSIMQWTLDDPGLIDMNFEHVFSETNTIINQYQNLLESFKDETKKILDPKLQSIDQMLVRLANRFDYYANYSLDLARRIRRIIA